MIIKYCPSCMGYPYTKKTNMTTCPVCNSELETEVVNDKAFLKGRPKLESKGNDHNNPKKDITNEPSFGYNDLPDPIAPTEPSKPTAPVLFDPSEMFKKRPESSNTNTGNTIRGRVINYKCSDDEGGKYHRMFIHKIFDMFVYGQKTDDVLHRFCVHVEQSDSYGYTQSQDTPVNVHGSISNGLSISDNCEVEVRGKYNLNHVFMARDVYVTGYGDRTKVKFKHDLKCLADLIFAFICIILTAITLIRYDGSFTEGVTLFAKVMAVMFIIFTILYLLLFGKFLVIGAFLGKNKFSLSGVFFLSFFSSLLFMNRDLIFASSGSAISGFLQSVISTIIVFAVIVLLIKIMIKI